MVDPVTYKKLEDRSISHVKVRKRTVGINTTPTDNETKHSFSTSTVV